MSAEAFWREPLQPLITAARSRMTEYVVLGKEPVLLRQNISKRKTNRKQKSRLASLTLAREDDLGVNDRQIEERTHVGYLMRSGDVCLGYDLKETQFVNDEAEEMRENGKLPDVIVIRKLYGGAATGDEVAAKIRIWRLQRMDVDVAEEQTKRAKNTADQDAIDEEEFMQEIEADREMRLNMNLYKTEVAKKQALAAAAIDEADDEDDDDQAVKLEELLDGLVVDAEPDVEDQILHQDVQSFAGIYVEGENAARAGLSYVPREDARHIQERDAATVVTGQLGTDFAESLILQKKKDPQIASDDVSL
jgi:nonsense-mediated mRNA decay protein 3